MAVRKRPNFLLIVVDDLGFSDIDAFSGEILQDAVYYLHDWKAVSGSGSTKERTPHAQGFDRSFALLPNGTLVFAHWAGLYYEDDQKGG
ncbi:hypothetical protein V8C42DRAFT_348749 [Trichoderma barbatum]